MHTKESLAAALIFVVIFSVNLTLINIDDVYLMYGSQDPSYWARSHSTNYRYLISIIANATNYFGLDFSKVSGFWIVTCAFSIWFSSFSFVKFLGLPIKITPLFMLLVGLHGYWADLHQFAINLPNLSVSLIGVSISLISFRQYAIRPAASVACGFLGCLITFFSYQPFVCVLLYAFALGYIADTVQLKEPKNQRQFRSFLPPLVSIGAACATFTLAAIMVPDWLGHIGRPISGDVIKINALRYFQQTLWDPFFYLDQPYHLIFPIHERILVGLSLLVLPILIATTGAQRARKFTAVAVLVAAFSLTANPLNIATINYWPSPRGMAHAAFLFAGALAIIGYTAIHRMIATTTTVGAVALSIIVLSLGNQITLLWERYRQAQQDEIVAIAIVEDLKKLGATKPGTMIAFASPRTNVAQLHRVFFLDFAASSFTADWSAVPRLRMVSGADLRTRDLPDGACANTTEPWEIRRLSEGYALCMGPIN
ncbi:hypothetical protein GA830_12260 [Mesorhizobium sp. NBSH29]|uniref:hypothetical protein n=1 Tax=Mesorhizobium sp. NBSH29 TaxID=2654249 RepID=UPI0018968CCA|nr:hypothetical protein [Mesorhizobium sp. NBSH29]QPC87431.1 hypothetical protein GA830_12260 [Mesorhizobium sp. NBSH29]